MDARTWAGGSAVLLPSLPAQVHRRYLDESTLQQQGLDENQAVAADTQQLAPIDSWYRSGGGRRAPALAVSAGGRS